MGQVGFQRTVPLVLHGTGEIGRTHRIEGVDGTVPPVLHGTSGMGRTHRIECVDGTGNIP